MNAVFLFPVLNVAETAAVVLIRRKFVDFVPIQVCNFAHWSFSSFSGVGPDARSSCFSSFFFFVPWCLDLCISVRDGMEMASVKRPTNDCMN